MVVSMVMREVEGGGYEACGYGGLVLRCQAWCRLAWDLDLMKEGFRIENLMVGREELEISSSEGVRVWTSCMETARY